MALAYKEQLPLITEDRELGKKSASIGIQVYSVDEFLAAISLSKEDQEEVDPDA